MSIECTIYESELNNGCLKYFMPPDFFRKSIKATFFNCDYNASVTLVDNITPVAWELMRYFIKSCECHTEKYVMIGRNERQTRFLDADEADGFHEFKERRMSIVQIRLTKSRDGKRFTIGFHYI